MLYPECKPRRTPIRAPGRSDHRSGSMRTCPSDECSTVSLDALLVGTAKVSCPPLNCEKYAVRGDQEREPGKAEEPCEDNVGEPVVAEEDPAESHSGCPGDGQYDAQGDAEAAGEP